ncbi:MULTISPECIES: hypothetical protein [Moorena]|uniref:hypothetical protein n=1 Tax=Moorena TaxID=1155738 RepID=UPI00142B58EF|nr:hypothetical protein [Moorena sp. SIO4G3]NEO80082.1 hypothetical protein [Moorena sp. SIO4G3]
MKHKFFFNQGFVASSFIGLFFSVSVQAQQCECPVQYQKCIKPGSATNNLNQARICDYFGGVSAYQGKKKLDNILRKVLQPPARLNVDPIVDKKSEPPKANLLFNEGTFVRFLPGAKFEFEKGLTRLKLKERPDIEDIGLERLNLALTPTQIDFISQKHHLKKVNSIAVKRLAQEQSDLITEATIFKLNQGTLLTMNPPNSVLTEIRTPGNSLVELGAKLSEPSQDQNLFLAPTRSSAVIVRHDSANNTTQVFSLTNSGIRVSGQDGDTVVLQGGETVSVTNGIVGEVQSFDLLRFYQTTTLAYGLGPGQNEAIAVEPVEVQKTIRAVRVETLAALEDQRTELDGGSPIEPDPIDPTVDELEETG